MPSLGDQLASLSASSSSARHHGFSTIVAKGGGGNKRGSNNATTTTPTLLYDNSRDASKVPLSTLRENAIAAFGGLIDAVVPTAATASRRGTAMRRFLEEDGGGGILSRRNLDEFERGTSTAEINERVDDDVRNLASWLSTLLREDDDSTGRCMVVIEYLLRLYELHSRPRGACVLLTTLLPLLSSPSSSSSSSYFVRAASLIESRGIGLDNVEPPGCWTFLGGARSFDRRALAIRASKDDALSLIVARMGENAAYISSSAGWGGGGGGGGSATGGGASAAISLSASVLVESLHIQSTSNGGVREGTVRALLPLVLSACGRRGHSPPSSRDNGKDDDDDDDGGGGNEGGCAEWRGWGRILASTLASCCPSLGRDAKIAMCDAIVDGLEVLLPVLPPPSSSPSSSKKKKERKKAKSSSFREEASGASGATAVRTGGRGEEDDDDDDACGAVLALISVLGTMDASWTGEKHDDDDDDDDDYDGEDWRYHLPMLPPSKKTTKRNNRKGSSSSFAVVVDCLGCELPPSTYKRLSKKGRDVVAFAISTAARAVAAADGEGEGEDEDGRIAATTMMMERIAPLLASIIMHALRRLEREGEKLLSSDDDGDAHGSSSDVRCRADRDVLLILGLIREPSLSSLWRARRSALVAAVTVRSIVSYDRLIGGRSGGLLGGRTTSSSSSAAAAAVALLLERYKPIVEALSVVDREAHDRGVAYVVDEVVIASASASSIDGGGEGNDEGRVSRLADLLGRRPIAGGEGGAGNGGGGGGTSATDRPLPLPPPSVASLLLPARVALESADASVRLDAVSRLISEEAGGGCDADMLRALLRRLASDDDAAVAGAAGSFVAGHLKRAMAGEGVGDDDDMRPEDDDANDRPSSVIDASLVDDATHLAKEALASLLRWTSVGRDDSWSPMTSVDSRDKVKTSKGNAEASEEVPSPLLSCISICGSVARLILDHESLDDVTESTANLFHDLFLSLGAHVTVGRNDAVSDAASAELLQLFDDVGAISTVPEFITKHPGSHKVLNHYFGAHPNKVSTPVPGSLRSRFLWLALKSYSDVLSISQTEEGPSSAILQVTLNLVLNQMQSYTKGSKQSKSFGWEAQFLLDLCKRYLSLAAIKDGCEFEQCIMDLASISSNDVSFDEIVKPAIISSQMDSLTTKGREGHGLAALLKTCLHPTARSSGSSRLLSIALELAGGESTNSNTARECVIPTLALLSHPERAIRDIVIRLLEQFQLILKDQVLLDICSKATDKCSPLRSSLVMDGANTLPNLLGQIVLTSGSLAAQKFLVEGCKTVVFTEGGKVSAGGCQASAIILSSMEKAGENAFSLSTRWDSAGEDLFAAFLRYDQTDLLPSLGFLRDCVLSMLKGVVVNEAQAGGDGLSIQISIGPSLTGRRMRSYSVGAAGGFSTLEHYPENMLQAVLKSLSSSGPPLLLSKHVIQLVIARQSWANGVFPKLTGKSRNAVTSTLLTLRTRDNDEHAGSALLGLPLRSSDFIQMLAEVDASRSEVDQSAIVFITDCIRGKLDVLGSTADVSMLSTKLFEQLISISSLQNSMASDGDSGSRDYTRVSILQTLYAIHSSYKSQLSKAVENDGKHSSKKKRSRSHSDAGSHKSLASEANLLVGLVGGNASTYYPLNSGRGRALSLSLLTCLCEESPSAVVNSLLPALMNLSEASPREDATSGKKVDLKALGEAVVAIVPAYCKHAPAANLSLFNLLEALVGKIVASDNEHEKSSYILLDNLVAALKLLPMQGSSNDAIASLAACVMAMQAFNLQKPTVASDAKSESLDTDKNSHGRLDARVLSNLKSGIKIGISLALLQYAESLMAYICGLSDITAEEPTSDKMKVRVSEVAALALRGANVEAGIQVAAYSQLSKAQQRSILYLTITLLQSVRDALSTRMARQVVRKSKGDDADLCLRLWNELMQTHTYALRAHAKLGASAMNSIEKKFWDAAPIATGDCLDNLQNLLPVPHFLASVSSALDSNSEVDIYIRKKSLKFLADRVAELSPDSPEASLFLEMVPDLVALVDVDRSAAASGEDSTAYVRRTIIMQQSALIAIECLVRSLYPTTDTGKLAANAAAAFLPALASITRLLDNTASSWMRATESCNDVISGVADAECQLLSSTSLCVSTIVTTLKARCLPQLPSIVKPLVATLKSVNDLLGRPQEKAVASGELLQLSILKTLKALAETLPQFLPPFLPLLFSNNALPSLALKQGTVHGERSVRAAALEVETTLASKTQMRQLVPALSQALSKNLNSEVGNWREASNNLSLMNIAVEFSQRADLSPVIGKIFNGLVMAYGYEGDESGRPQLLMSANKCLLSLVMKLSEAQLRPLYARLREWRGDIKDNSEGQSSAVRRHAFWSLSAELSRSLRSIFLPCLTSVLPDVIDELEIAGSLLCQHTKKVDGSKRRRIEESDAPCEVMEKVMPLQPLLLCLESALKADAHEGGDWTRGDDTQRYNMILNHLGKLLLSQVPKEIPLLSDLSSIEKASTSTYQQLVQGVGTLEHGNVVGCLTALATAAGNEQLWKPLNFAVLEACGHKRSEVRKAGISCLLSIIETIGEEYMVLLPECLPVLSELLEDEEDIAGMAKECVRQGEELLGESLEDSLR